MKLIHGKFHDYYDVVEKHGHSSQGNIYLRNPETIVVKYDKNYTKEKGWHYTKENHPLSFLIKDSYNYSTDNYRFKNKSRYSVKTFKVLFCGKVYKGLKFANWNNTERYYCYDIDSVAELFKQNDDILPQKPNKKQYYYFSLDPDQILTVESLTNYFKVTDYSDICIANKYVIAGLFTSPHTNGTEIVLNCRLQDYEFYRVFDSYSAYQTLAQYVDGMLAYPGNIVTDIPDEYKIESKGFDKKYSFRTRPKGN